MASATYYVNLGILGEEVEVEVTYTMTPYIEATMYRSNGDPGDPAEGGEIEIEKITCEEYPSLADKIGDILADDDDFLEYLETQSLDEEYEIDYDYS